jgi:hypothetical protein
MAIKQRRLRAYKAKMGAKTKREIRDKRKGV